MRHTVPWPWPKPLLPWASRKVLCSAEVHDEPRKLADDETQKALTGLSSLRIALVKQEVQVALPNFPGKHPIADFIRSATSHTGCLSLLHELGAELILVREAPDSECRLWEQKVARDPDPESSRRCYREVARTQPFWTPAGPRTRHEVAQDPDEIDWSAYDLVVSIDVSVPERLIQKTRHTVWACLLSEPGMPLYRALEKRPGWGMDLFLNQKCRVHRVRPCNRPHVLDFPWAYQSAACHANPPAPERPAVSLDPHTLPGDLAILKKGLPEMNVRILRGLPPSDFLSGLGTSRYFVKIGPRKTWGAILIESACAGCLVMGDPRSVECPSPLLPEAIVQSSDHVLSILRVLEANPEQRRRLRETQMRKVAELAWRRPTLDLWKAFQNISKRKSRRYRMVTYRKT